MAVCCVLEPSRLQIRNLVIGQRRNAFHDGVERHATRHISSSHAMYSTWKVLVISACTISSFMFGQKSSSFERSKASSGANHCARMAQSETWQASPTGRESAPCRSGCPPLLVGPRKGPSPSIRVRACKPRGSRAAPSRIVHCKFRAALAAILVQPLDHLDFGLFAVLKQPLDVFDAPVASRTPSMASLCSLFSRLACNRLTLTNEPDLH